jgi:hypothetical protein
MRPQSLSLDDAQRQTAPQSQSIGTQMGLDPESGYDPDSQVAFPEPPGIEDGWLPEIIKDKS